MTGPSLEGRPIGLQWALLLAVSVGLVALLESARLPAGVLLGAMAGGILVAALDGRIRVPPPLYLLAQGFVGCLMARAIQPQILVTIGQQWPIFLVCVGAVIVLGVGLGGVLARLQVLPGTTAVWGSAPGAATVMVVMSEAFGGDIRLVGLMQFLRVVLVALAASVVARLWGHPGHRLVAPTDWFPTLPVIPSLQTAVLAILGAFAGARSLIPAGALLVPLFVGAALSCTHLLAITLAPWLLAVFYAVVGWAIGLGFTRTAVVMAARLVPRITASVVTLIALCGGLACVLHLVAGTDPLTAYLATSPGGADSIAIIATSSPVDQPFVMAMQTARFLLVLLLGPTLARLVARWAQPTARPAGVGPRRPKPNPTQGSN